MTKPLPREAGILSLSPSPYVLEPSKFGGFIFRHAGPMGGIWRLEDGPMAVVRALAQARKFKV